MKELYTIGQEFERHMASGQMFVPTFEQVRDIQQAYLELLRIVNGGKDIPPPEDQQAML